MHVVAYTKESGLHNKDQIGPLILAPGITRREGPGDYLSITIGPVPSVLTNNLLSLEESPQNPIVMGIENREL